MGRSISLSCLRVDLVYVVTYHASDCEEKFSLQHYGYQRSIGKLWIHFICDTYLSTSLVWKTTINQEFCIAPDARWKPYFVATQCSTAGNLFPSLARWYLRPTGQHENDHCILLRGTRAPMAYRRRHRHTTTCTVWVGDNTRGRRCGRGVKLHYVGISTGKNFSNYLMQLRHLRFFTRDLLGPS